MNFAAEPSPAVPAKPQVAWLTFQLLLREANIPTDQVVALRHTPAQKDVRLLLPKWVSERPELFEAYQAFQGSQVAAMLKRVGFLASFIGQDSGRATFAGLWRIRNSRRIEDKDLDSAPVAELQRLGVPFTVGEDFGDSFFELELTPHYADWIGRLVVNWPARGINWKLRADNHEFPVWAITDENQFAAPLPDWNEISLSWAQLCALPKSWKIALQQRRGVYYVFDEKLRLGYVGSASGQENLMGRWEAYVASGHGGNVGLKGSDPQNLRFSILQVTAQDLPADDVLKIEYGWMKRLCTASHGLNKGGRTD